MVEGSQRQAWEHTSSIVCVIANANRDPKERSKPFEPDYFNPYYANASADSGERLIVPLSFLKPLFVKPE